MVKNVPLMLVLGKELIFFNYDKNYNPVLVDETVPVDIGYNRAFDEFVTPANTSIKTWDIFTGKIKRVYQDVTNAREITAFAIDHPCKRYAVGDFSGNTSIINHINGAFIKQLSSH